MLSTLFWFFMKLAALGLAANAVLICMVFAAVVLLALKHMIFD